MIFYKIQIIILLMKIITIEPYSLNLYVLKLIKDKYYVGISRNDITIRYKQHLKGNSATWTRMYKPLYIIESIKTNTMFDEDKYTKIYMNKFGIENVRGGSYSNIILEDYQLKTLDKEFKNVNNLCFKCGEKGHFAANCNKK